MTPTTKAENNLLRSRNRLIGTALVGCSVFALNACSSGSAKDTSHSAPASSASTSATPADPDAAEKARVLKAYRSMWDARNLTYAKAELDPDLEKYANNKALSNIKATLAYYQDHGIVTKGTTSNSPEVTGINTTAQPKKATIRDCVDTSNYYEVTAKTGKKAPVGDKNGDRRHVYNATAITSHGRWVIWTTEIDRGAKC
ncbi:hypothetical protein [Streptomyces sp. NPDC048527]|uniref:hypothetical protein n=1 Tax=Streptomyces sp. NPDC048527 TaxID=3365568 RepID=UPI003724BFF1